MLRAAAIAAALVACAPPTGDLLDNTLWAPLDPADDPLADHRPPDATCPDSAWYPEGVALEVFTGDCTYAALTQPLRLDVPRRGAVQIFAWHAPLFAEDDEPSEGHIALLVDDLLLWEAHVEIPNTFGVFNVTLTPPRRLRAGEPAIFHLHNHGANTWELVAVRAMGPDAR